jgi:predicted oxidoreductase (fatty acid repression mutant protein)
MASTQLTKNVLEAIKERRTYYQLNKEAPISDSKIKELTEQALLHVPSSFNSQSTRIVVLLNKDHEQFWDYVIEVLKPLTPEGSFDGTKQKINGFRAAYGTVSDSCSLSVSCGSSGAVVRRCSRQMAPRASTSPTTRTHDASPTTRLAPFHARESPFATTNSKTNMHTQVLFYEAPEPVENLRKAFPLYAHHFGDWSEHTNAMHQYALWVALEAEGFGANLQHYNPIIDQKAAEHWSIPLEWKLRSQLVFGGRAGEPGEKQFQKTFGERLFVHGSKE